MFDGFSGPSLIVLGEASSPIVVQNQWEMALAALKNTVFDQRPGNEVKSSKSPLNESSLWAILELTGEFCSVLGAILAIFEQSQKFH